MERSQVWSSALGCVRHPLNGRKRAKNVKQMGNRQILVIDGRGPTAINEGGQKSAKSGSSYGRRHEQRKSKR